MKSAFFLALLAFGGPVFATESSYGYPSVVPHLVDGDGWKTIITLVNLDDTAASFTLKFYAEDGTPAIFPTNVGTAATLTGTIVSRGAMTIETLGTATALKQGWILVNTPSLIGGTAIFRRVLPGQPNYEASEAIDTGQWSRVAMPFDHLNGAATGFAIVNQINVSSGPISIVFRDENGQPLLTDSFTLVPLGHYAITLTQKYPQLIGKRGTFEITASGVYINVLALHFLNGSFTTITPLRSWIWQ